MVANVLPLIPPDLSEGRAAQRGTCDEHEHCGMPRDERSAVWTQSIDNLRASIIPKIALLV